MLEQTLACLGNYIKIKSGLPKQQILFAERELIFHYLSAENFPVVLPAIAFSISDISDPQEFRPQKFIGDYTIDFNSVEAMTLIPINISVNIAFLADNFSDYINFFKIYYSLIKDREFIVELKSIEPETKNDLLQAKFTCVLNNHSSLSTPPGGLEGRDYDKGKYYVMEGSFEINSFAAYSQNYPVIRKNIVNSHFYNLNPLL